MSAAVASTMTSAAGSSSESWSACSEAVGESVPTMGAVGAAPAAVSTGGVAVHGESVTVVTAGIWDVVAIAVVARGCTSAMVAGDAVIEMGTMVLGAGTRFGVAVVWLAGLLADC